MKKVLILFAFTGIVVFSACGPSAEEKAAMEKARQDSTAAVEAARQDSIEAAQEAMEIMEKARQDSIAAAEQAKQEAAKNKGATKPKTPEEKMNKEAKKATQGRG